MIGNKTMTILTSLLILQACASTNKAEQRITLDNSNGGLSQLPEWTRTGQTAWVDSDNKNMIFVATYTVRGDQRVNACFDLARIDMKENVLAEISTKIKSEMNLATDGTNENAEVLLTKSFHQQSYGQLKGLKIQQQVFERYKIGENERIDCYVLGKLSIENYNLIKNVVNTQLVKISSEVADSVRKKQVDFFNQNSN